MARKKKDWVAKQGKWTAGSLKEAIFLIRTGQVTLHKASRLYNIPRTTLGRRLANDDLTSPATRPLALTTSEEDALSQHVLEMEERGFGLTIKNVCKLAYSIVQKSGRENPFNQETKSAGYDWWQGFRDRHPCLSLRKPEGLSAARSSMLNPNVINQYFDTLKMVLEKTGLANKPNQIYNVDESGLRTVHDPPKIIGKKGKSSIHSKTSAERGENVTVVCCVNAAGGVFPPMIIFKGQRLSQALMNSAPSNTLFATSKNAFIDTDLFHDWFQKLFLPNLPPQRPVLLVLDGHVSHVSLGVLELAKKNDVEVVCLPPHTSHWTQPLDRTVFGPLKKEYYKYCEVFMRQNPDRLITRYDFCSLFRSAFNSKMNLMNITSGFKATGIHPFNPSKIPNEAYGPSKTSVIAEEVNATGAAPARVPVSSESNGTHHIDAVLKLPEVIKEPTSASTKSRKTTKARCLTENEFIQELRAKEELINKQRSDKETKQKELAERRAQKERDNLKRKFESEHSAATKLKKVTMKKNKPASDKPKKSASPKSTNELYCAACSGYYYDEGSNGEDWWQCTQCTDWYHESCTEKVGQALQQFVCTKH